MKKLLKDLLDSKESLNKFQRLFTKTLKENYPSLVSEDVETHERALEGELTFLLSSSVKYKTGRIVIEAPKMGHQKKVVLTRNPGLKYPHHSYAAFDLLDVEEIDKDGNLMRALYRGRDVSKIMLSTLKVNARIDQEKLKKFYEFLKEGLIWKSNLSQFLNVEFKDEKTVIPVGDHRIKIYSNKFEIGILNPLGERKYNKFTELQSGRFIQYETRFHEDEMIISYQDTLMEFWRHFKDFEIALKGVEKLKAKSIKKAKNLTKRLKDFNKPFRILNKLLLK